MRHALIAVVLVASPAVSAELKLISWNIESGGNDPATIAEELQDLPKQHVYCLQEVSASNAGRYAYAIRETHGDSYRYLMSHTGRGDRLMFIFDSDRLELFSVIEMFQHEDYELNDWRHRSPFVLHLKDKATGKEFYLLTAHFARGSRSLRKEQATGLREWARSLTVPAVLMGDLNLDFFYPDNEGNAAYDALLADGSPWEWVRPATDIDTNWSDRDGDGVDNYPDSCLDFCFKCGVGLGDTEAEVLVRPGDFPDGDDRSDHRPVLLTIGG